MGLSVAVAGAILYTIVWINFATTPIDAPVTKGRYRYSRHPMRVIPFLPHLGVSIVMASWLFLVLSITFTVLSSIAAIPEERFRLARYGPAYQECRDRTPRWLGKPR